MNAYFPYSTILSKLISIPENILTFNWLSWRWILYNDSHFLSLIHKNIWWMIWILIELKFCWSSFRLLFSHRRMTIKFPPIQFHSVCRIIKFNSEWVSAVRCIRFLQKLGARGFFFFNLFVCVLNIYPEEFIFSPSKCK